MKEIYWISRIGHLGDSCLTVSIVGVIAFALIILLFPMMVEMADEYDVKERFYRYIRYAVVVWLVSLLGNLFIPTRKEMIAIYGIGSVIDYVQSSDKAKALPDKAVEAITKYLEEEEE